MKSALLFTLTGLLFTAGCRSGPSPVPAEPEHQVAARQQPTSAERFWRSYIGTTDRYYELLEKQADRRRADRRLDRRKDCHDDPQHRCARGRKPGRRDRR